MKKNAMLKIAAVLLVAVLLTTCAISSTFAKYTTGTKTDTESAHVAGWGLNLTAAYNGDLFTDVYGAGNEVNGNGTAVMAPGTSGEASFVSTVTKDDNVNLEVDAEITYTFDVQVNGFADSYCPVVVTINGTECEATTGALLQSEIIAALETELAGDTLIKAGTTDFTDYNRTVAISWNWAFEGNDTKDTDLGDNPTANTITITISAVINQVKPTT